MCRQDCDFCGTMQWLCSDERARAHFKRRMGRFSNRIDNELMADICSECRVVH